MSYKPFENNFELTDMTLIPTLSSNNIFTGSNTFSNANNFGNAFYSTNINGSLGVDGSATLNAGLVVKGAVATFETLQNTFTTPVTFSAATTFSTTTTFSGNLNMSYGADIGAREVTCNTQTIGSGASTNANKTKVATCTYVDRQCYESVIITTDAAYIAPQSTYMSNTIIYTGTANATITLPIPASPSTFIGQTFTIYATGNFTIKVNCGTSGSMMLGKGLFLNGNNGPIMPAYNVYTFKYAGDTNTVRYVYY